MKIETIGSVCFRDIQKKLKLTRCEAIGLMEFFFLCSGIVRPGICDDSDMEVLAQGLGWPNNSQLDTFQPSKSGKRIEEALKECEFLCRGSGRRAPVGKTRFLRVHPRWIHECRGREVYR